MTDPAIIEAAVRALRKEALLFEFPESCTEIGKAVLAAVTPLIEAAALEKAACMVDGLGSGDDEEWAVIARDIRALITKDSPIAKRRAEAKGLAMKQVDAMSPEEAAAEDAAIQAGIDQDADARELTDADFASMRPAHEVHPELVAAKIHNKDNPFEFDENNPNPDWSRAGRVHDWRNHVGENVKAIWGSFSPTQRIALALDADELASREEWE
jgi:hypothetical protein